MLEDVYQYSLYVLYKFPPVSSSYIDHVPITLYSLDNTRVSTQINTLICLTGNTYETDVAANFRV